MKRLPLLSSALALSLAVSTPAALAHVGHGDEFQAEGGVDRVEVNAETDPILGIQVNPIEPAADNSGAIMIPVSALVEDNGRQLVFVLYESFYEPVPVTTGGTEGEMVEVLEGLSAGEQLVTQGSLSLYAESRKTQTAEATSAETAPAETAALTTDEAHAQADAEGVPHEHDDDGNMVTTETEAGGMPQWLLAVLGGGIGLAIGAFALTRGGKQESVSSDEATESQQENA
ncbi:MAG: cobalt transporter [Leptolyngbya sp. SIOISBB]|nr:cobalt transporter [Leptolyngbya sp. SIOISBB]